MKRGFTLIELLVVIAIIGLLSSVVFASLNSARQKARNARSIADLAQLKTALELYYNDNNAYPSTSGRYDGLYSCWGNSTTDWIPGLAPNYIPTLPRSPNNSTNCGDNYIYRSDNGTDYKLIWHGPQDCAGVKAQAPGIIDPVRDCWAYGNWSTGGRNY